MEETTEFKLLVRLIWMKAKELVETVNRSKKYYRCQEWFCVTSEDNASFVSYDFTIEFDCNQLDCYDQPTSRFICRVLCDKDSNCFIDEKEDGEQLLHLIKDPSDIEIVWLSIKKTFTDHLKNYKKPKNRSVVSLFDKVKYLK